MARKSFTLKLPFKPKAKGRPRAGKYGMYTDKATREYENLVKETWVVAGAPKFDGPVTLTLTFHKSHIDVTVSEASEESSLRGDVDNYVKSLMDGLNGVAYDDDGQVVNLKAFKR